MNNNQEKARESKNIVKRDSRGRILPGYSGNPSGRPPGLKSKTTEIKLAFYEAFERLGGVNGLLRWIKSNEEHKKDFYKMLLSILPKEIDKAGLENVITATNMIVIQNDKRDRIQSDREANDSV